MLVPLIAADHKILNLEDESRNDNLNDIIAQDGLLSWVQSNHMKSKDVADTASCPL